MSQESYPELEHFREQWRAEVTARTKAATSIPEGPGEEPGPPPRLSRRRPVHKRHPAVRPPFSSKSIPDVEVEDYGPEDPESRHHEFGADIAGPSEPSSSSHSTQEPQSGLDHYEKAVERENQGNLGDSLSHYRKAYRVCSPQPPPTLYAYRYS